MITLDNNQIIQEILRGDDTTLREMYHRYHAQFMRALRPNWKDVFSDNTLMEAYAYSIGNFYIRVKTGKLIEMTHTVEAYLIKTGKNWLIKEAKRLNRMPQLNPSTMEPTDNETVLTQIMASEWEEEHKTRLRRGMTALGKKCQELLMLSYWGEKSVEHIMDIMGYADENTVYASKARCIKKLRELINK